MTSAGGGFWKAYQDNDMKRRMLKAVRYYNQGRIVILSPAFRHIGTVATGHFSLVEALEYEGEGRFRQKKYRSQSAELRKFTKEEKAVWRLVR
jgi:hypothetical protein